jgi:hypothetical protein
MYSNCFLCKQNKYFDPTLLSQLPAIRKFCGKVAGLKESEEIESSGGDVTSKSLIGFVALAGDAPTNEEAPPRGF